MTEISLTKRATASKAKNALENFSKLKAYAYQGAILAQEQAKEKGIAFTIMKKGKIYKVYPDGREVEGKYDQISDHIAFEAIRIIY